MDFTKHDIRTASEKQREVRLRHPATGEYIKDEDSGEFCAVLIVGSQARSVQSGILEEARFKLSEARSKKKKEEQAAALENVQKTLVEGASRVIRGFKHIEREGVPLTTTKEDLEWFLDLNFVSVKALMSDSEDEDAWLGDSFAQQVLRASNNSALFLGE